MTTYHSTRGGNQGLSFRQAVLTGLADDGGLIVPEQFPVIPHRILEQWRHLTYQELAYNVMSLFINPQEIPPMDLMELIDKSYSLDTFRSPSVTPIHSFKDKPLHILELYHGPTFAFKDIALQFLGNLFEYFLSQKGSSQKRMTVVGATSGDTGSSAIYGLKGKENIDVYIMYPRGKVSKIQESQMTTILDENIHNIAIDGTFDDCQAIVKKLFGDEKFKQTHQLGAINSINWARILAQIVYYFYAYFRVTTDKTERVSFSVPTGNFGDILAGFYAKKIGLPIEDLVVATNENDILHRFFSIGKYHRTDVKETVAPSMDICVSSNFERYLFSLSGEDSQTLKQWMTSFERTGNLTISGKLFEHAQAEMKSASVFRQQVMNTIHTYWTEYDYLLDPHTAIGVTAAEQIMANQAKKNTPMVVIGTAYAGKFFPIVQEAVGEDVLLQQHPLLARLEGLKTRSKNLPNDVEEVKKYIANNSSSGSRQSVYEYDASMLIPSSVFIAVVCIAVFGIHRMISS